MITLAPQGLGPEVCSEGPSAVVAPPPAPALAPLPAGSSAPPSDPRASISGSGSVSGGKISEAEKVFRAAQRDLRGCYQAALRRKPTIEGRVGYRVAVGADGLIKQTCLAHHGLDDEALVCVRGVLSNVRFQPPEAGSASIQGSYSFKPFSPVSWPWPVEGGANPPSHP